MHNHVHTTWLKSYAQWTTKLVSMTTIIVNAYIMRQLHLLVSREPSGLEMWNQREHSGLEM